jgi:hypothetical protein
MKRQKVYWGSCFLWSAARSKVFACLCFLGALGLPLAMRFNELEMYTVEQGC